jgi:hypothetical protein
MLRQMKSSVSIMHFVGVARAKIRVGGVLQLLRSQTGPHLI